MEKYSNKISTVVEKHVHQHFMETKSAANKILSKVGALSEDVLETMGDAVEEIYDETDEAIENHTVLKSTTYELLVRAEKAALKEGKE